MSHFKIQGVARPPLSPSDAHGCDLFLPAWLNGYRDNPSSHKITYG